MKKVALILLLAGVAFASCSGQTRKNNEQNKEEKKMKTIHLTKSEFLTKVVDYEKNPNEWKYLGDKPAIIDFYASWCGPCKMQLPIIEEFSGEMEGKATVGKVNVDEELELAQSFGIQSIPTLILFKDGKPVKKLVGLHSKEALYEEVNQVL